MEMIAKQESIVGFIAIMIWCAVSAGAYVFTGYIEESVDPILLCFGVFLVSTLFFGIINFKKTTQIKGKYKNNLKNIMLVNITTLGCWFLTLYPLKYIEPSIVNSVILTALPIATLIIGHVLSTNKNITNTDYIVSTLLFFGIFFLALVCFSQKSAMKNISLHNALIAFISCIGGGLSLAINNIYTKKLSNKGFSPFDILTVRFILITIIAGILSYSMIDKLHNLKLIIDIFIIAGSLIIIPQIVFQYSLRDLEPITISIVAPLMPILVFFSEFYNKQLHPTTWTIAGVIYISAISIVGTVIRYQKITK
jgi:drug/metabolite transporter (DMT)-like permease